MVGKQQRQPLMMCCRSLKIILMVSLLILQIQSQKIYPAFKRRSMDRLKPIMKIMSHHYKIILQMNGLQQKSAKSMRETCSTGSLKDMRTDSSRTERHGSGSLYRIPILHRPWQRLKKRRIPQTVNAGYLS